MEVSFFAHAKALTRLVANDTAGLIAIEASRASYEIWHIEGKKALAIETARISLGQHKGLIKDLNTIAVGAMECGRHSFAVLAINKGMPIESISRILGHTNITTTQIYAKITMNKIDSDMVELGKKLSTQSHIGYVER